MCDGENSTHSLPSSHQRSRRAFLAGSIGLAVSACGQNQLGADLVAATRYLTVGLPGPEITREMVDAIPYATVAVRIGRGPRSLLVLWETKGEARTWASADGVALQTRYGRIVDTAGLPEDISNTVFSQVDPLAIGIDQLDSFRTPYTRTVDFKSSQKYGVQITSTMRILGRRKIKITAIDFDTILVEEKCRARQINWSYRNRFWLDPVDGFVWKSEQYTARDIPVFVVEVLKPAQA